MCLQVDVLNRRYDELTADLGKGEDTGEQRAAACQQRSPSMQHAADMHMVRSYASLMPAVSIRPCKSWKVVGRCAAGPLEALIREVQAQLAGVRADSGRLQRVWAARQTTLAALQVLPWADRAVVDVHADGACGAVRHSCADMCTTCHEHCPGPPFGKHNVLVSASYIRDQVDRRRPLQAENAALEEAAALKQRHIAVLTVKRARLDRE
jgi:hypothetical protein